MAGVAATTTVAGASSNSSPSVRIEKPPRTSLTETGSTLLYPLWNIWVPAYTQMFHQVSITTASTGSGTGISSAAAGTVDIGSSDAYLSPSELSSDPTLINIPLAISAQMVAYNLPGVTAHLRLSGKVVSEIYQARSPTGTIRPSGR